MQNRQQYLKSIFKVDEVLQDEHLVFLRESFPHTLIVDTIRQEIQNLRQSVLTQEEIPDTLQDKDKFIEQVIQAIYRNAKPSLSKVINATGTVLHTNLGRACLSEEIGNRVKDVACHYSTLEYDVKKGKRGSRHEHVETLIQQVTGAEAAMVVNNNAAATMLVLATIAAQKEVVVSRGELVEIGGSFRIPEIMELSGAYLREVGTTNKTHLKDYEKAYVAENTAAFMKIHTSNYRIIGFTEDVSLSDMVDLGHHYQLPVVYDMGNGLLLNLEESGVHEPTVMDAIKTGVDIILFSGDKLLGGPQAGIIIGKKDWIDQMKAHPLARVIRADKMSLAALEATFFAYLDRNYALEHIPVLKMLTETPEYLKEKANLLKEKIQTSTLSLDIVPCQDYVGGGSAPDTLLDGYALSIQSEKYSADKIEKYLRNQDLPVIVQISHDIVLLHLRTLDEEDFGYLAELLSNLR
jgi:L-seryl-tRNA(Ser) seleniumtransferase